MIVGVTIYFKGAARAKWCESMDNGVRRTEIEHDKEEIYFDDRFCLWGQGKKYLPFHLLLILQHP